MSEALRLLVALVVVGLIARAARPAWRHRRLAFRVWSQVRPRHVLGSLALLAVVVTVALSLLRFVPVTGISLGGLIGITGNAVFAPIDELAARSGTDLTPTDSVQGTAPEPVNRGLTLAAIGGFLAVLLALFPWLAYVEELAFRDGLERAGTAAQVWRALRFGLAHLVMLVPLAAALAIAVAGFFYGRVYLRAYARDGLRSEAILAATTWHVTFNSLVVLGVFAGLVFAL